MESQEGESSKVREVKSVITLRSVKQVDQPISKPKHDEESVAEKEKKNHQTYDKDHKCFEKIISLWSGTIPSNDTIFLHFMDTLGILMRLRRKFSFLLDCVEIGEPWD